jgi:tetratricopeptide (TPR) repeat protein
LDDKGLTLFSLGDHVGALKFFDTSLKINPRNANALYNKAWVLQHLCNCTGAIEYYDKELAITPNDKDALYNRNLALHALAGLARTKR